jgi:hypothetical protein
MRRIGVFSDRALLQRLAFLDRTERALYQRILNGAPRAGVAGGIPNAGLPYKRQCAAVREVREHMARVEAELLRRRGAAMSEAA